MENMWSGLIWLNTRTNGAFLWTYRAFWFHEGRDISWLSEEPLPSQQGFQSLELTSQIRSESDGGYNCGNQSAENG